MSRNNIFQIMESKRDFSQEIRRLEALLHDKRGVAVYTTSIFDMGVPPDPIYMNIEQFVDQYAFKDWKCRGTCIDLTDMSKTLGIEDMFDDHNLTEEEILIYAEYVANVLFLAECVECTDEFWYKDTVIVTTARKNLESILGWMNYEQKVFPQKERVLVVRKSCAVSAVAEIVSEDLAYQIVRYNHNSLKGNIADKKAILLALGSELEPKRKDIRVINADLEDGIFYILNNLNLRHNNRSKKDKNYKEVVAKMRTNKLEKWYDELYQMFLLAYLELEQKERQDKIKELKYQISGGNTNG